MTSNKFAITVEEAITSRRSIRAFLPTPVPRGLVEEILNVAARAPSGANTQPWKVHVLTGETLRKLSADILAVHTNPGALKEHVEEYVYYPTEWVSPYVDRRRRVGLDLYGLLGIRKDEKEKMNVQLQRNFLFYGAPVGIIFTIDRVMKQGAWLDYGMFLENVMLLARSHGIDTCPQAAFTAFHRIISERLSLPESEMVVCGMSMGYEDPDAPENRLVTSRATASEFAKFYD